MANHARGKLANLTAGARRYQVVILAAVIMLIAAGLATYTAAASYDTVSHLAVRYGVALPRLNPLGIDGGVAGLIVLDIALTWIGEPIWWLRLCVRLFAAGMIAANLAAGWPSPIGMGLRVGAPVLFVILTEVSRTWLLRRKHAAERAQKEASRAARRTARKRRRNDRIPLVRWTLDPKGTFALWKRMRLWREPSYRTAVTMELERLAAIEKLAMRYGPAWQDHAPADLVWMLASGVRMAEALALVPELLAAEDAAIGAELEAAKAALAGAEAERDEAAAKAEVLARKLAGDRNRKRAGGGAARKRKPAGTGTRNPEPANDGTSALDDAPDMDTEARILSLIAEGHSASQAGILAGKSDSYGRQVARLARTAPQDIVDGKD
jgi:hypothetical protein